MARHDGKHFAQPHASSSLWQDNDRFPEVRGNCRSLAPTVKFGLIIAMLALTYSVSAGQSAPDRQQNTNAAGQTQASTGGAPTAVKIFSR